MWDHLTEYGQSKNRTGPILHRLSPPPGLYLVARSLGDLVAPGLTSGREVGLSETAGRLRISAVEGIRSDEIRVVFARRTTALDREYRVKTLARIRHATKKAL